MNCFRTFAFITTLLLPGVASAELIHLYDFSGDTEDSVGSADGVTSGDVILTVDRFGVDDSAYLFSGEGSIAMEISSLDTVSYSVWASWDGSGDDMLFNTGDDYSGPDLFFVNRSWCSAINWNVWDSCDNRLAETPLDATDGEYHNYVLVNDFTSNLTYLYYDGELLGTADYKESGDTFTVGSEWLGSYTYGWVGAIDDIEIYNNALSAEDVAEMYAASIELSMLNQDVTTQVPVPFTFLSLTLFGIVVRKSRT